MRSTSVGGGGRRAATALAVGALAWLALAPGPARAQMGIGPGGGMGPPTGAPPPGQPTQAPPGTPETHAAPEPGDEQRLQTQEPMLPEDPLEIPEKVAKRIGTDADREEDVPPDADLERRFYGLWYSEEAKNYRFRTLFPLWAERVTPGDRASLYTPFYYNRRSENVDADIVFPFLWRLRDGPTRTTIVGPIMHRERERTAETPGRHDNWVAPLFFEGASDDGSGYLHVPPLLTFTQHTDRSGFNVAGPLYCKWKGGPACDARTADSIDMGIAPVYLYGRDEGSEYEIIPPLLHYYSYTDRGDRSFNLWGPYLRESSREGDVLNIMPIFWRNWGPNEDHITVFPLVHYGYKGNARLLVTPLFLNRRSEEGDTTFVTLPYARHRGRTELDMVTPLFWHYRDPDIGLDRKLLFPLFYKNNSPRSDDIAIFPLYGRFHAPGVKDTRWVTPLFRHTRSLTGWDTSIYPFFHIGRENRSTHLVVAPFLWDFASPTSRATVILPGYFRFADREGVSQLALNTFYRERVVPGGTEWQFHFFPFFSYGESPNGHFWNLLFGMAGYTREGTMTKMRALYFPIKMSD